MKSRLFISGFILLALTAMIAGVLLLRPAATSPTGDAHGSTAKGKTSGGTASSVAVSSSDHDRNSKAETLIQAYLQAAQITPARESEAILTFKDRETWLAFLARAQRTGLRVIASEEVLHSVRIHFANLTDLTRELALHADEYTELAPNLLMAIPMPPPLDQRETADLVPLGNHLLAFLGIERDTSDWGRGVTVAIIDSAISPDPTFSAGRLRVIDLGIEGIPTAPPPGLGHGTAVTALVAGASPDARGVALAANLLAIPVLAEDGLSDAFTVSTGIITAVEAGAQIINLSLGSDFNSPTLQRAVDYAIDHGVLIVAAAGNNQSSQLSWPAADPRVVSVGAVDALGQQVTFSNSGPQLQIAAPGYGVQTAWTDGERVWFDGTSASAPIVTGAIAAVMSETPGTTAAQAWEIIRTHAAEAGPPGPDPDYGNGVIDLGWAMARDDYTRIDTAIASHVFDPEKGTVEIVIQNRSNNALSGLTLNVMLGGTPSTLGVPDLAPGATASIPVPIESSRATDPDAPLRISSSLINPPGVHDAVPANNQHATLLTVP